ncbi:MAG: SDR family NAD(P)-dependent oxidoreductase [Promethearchaeota archaeon]
MEDFKDKVAVITGAASGIGLGIAKKAVMEGMKVVIADIEEEALASAENILRKMGDHIVAVHTDVSKAEDIEKLAQKTIDSYGEVHLLFNNAGVALLNRLTWEHSLSDWEWIMGVNLWGVIHGIRIFVPIMLKQDNECYIINTSSLAGLIITPFQCVYNVTKHGIVALSETLSYELKELHSKIRVSVLCPGGVLANIVESERNRPIELRNHESELDFWARKKEILSVYPEFESKIARIREVFSPSIISPEKAGDIVFEAIKNNKFYILTHTDPFWKNMIKERMNGIFHAFNKR